MNIRESALAHKYARNFVEVISEREDIWHIFDELQSYVQIINETGLNRMLHDATVSNTDKEAFIRTLRHSSYRAVNDLIESVIQGGEYSLLREVLQVSMKLISKQKNEFDAYVSTFQALTKEQKRRIHALAESRFDVRIRQVIEEIDKELLGGFIVTVNHRVIDASVRTQLNDIRKKL
ncbi:F0F1 ATP synthase subunit delta [Streptococcus cameli]